MPTEHDLREFLDAILDGPSLPLLLPVRACSCGLRLAPPGDLRGVVLAFPSSGTCRGAVRCREPGEL
ncbi:hypothetical protein AQJ43_15865 [Streptomyces avermitilis]|nr:hypothetical protein AQJ43_15865 [Streptomyces avermitilis]OOV27399.1 hypothetical protein SM007_21875 [Streptomyces avermitilis]GDY81730.1 hypothetical protein SAVCW2_09290 [Streptomyces avermitilis]